MPIFPYHCPYCNSEFEVIRKSSDAGDERCPTCSQVLHMEHRTVGNISFDLKGTGWAKDGYK